MYLLTHSLSPVLVLVVVMGSMELKIARLFSCSFSDSLSCCVYYCVVLIAHSLLLRTKSCDCRQVEYVHDHPVRLAIVRASAHPSRREAHTPQPRLRASAGSSAFVHRRALGLLHRESCRHSLWRLGQNRWRLPFPCMENAHRSLFTLPVKPVPHIQIYGLILVLA